MTEDRIRELLNRLEGDMLKVNLSRAAVFLIAYEMLHDSIVDRLRDFFTLGGVVAHDQYRARVLRPKESVLMASCQWLREMGAMTHADIQEIDSLRLFRNRIAHEFPSVLLDSHHEIRQETLLAMHTLLCKLDRWWITQVEIPTIDDFNSEEVGPNDVASGTMILLGHLIRVVFPV